MSTVSTEKSVSSIIVGERIKFKTISPHDTTLYVGNIICVGNYDVAKVFGDIAAVQQDMLQINPNLPDISLMTYFVVDCYDGKKRPFSFDWISNGKVEVVDTGSTKLVRIYNVTAAQASEVIAILRQNNIVCNLVEN